jgi:hypothetical protein
MMAIRFYLRSGLYFEDVYHASNCEKKYRRRNYAWDFLSGFIHFLFFSFLALSIAPEKNWWFYGFLLAILLYDVLWWFMSRKLSTRWKIRRWAVFNSLTAVLSGLVTLGTFHICSQLATDHSVSQWQRHIAEGVGFAPVLLGGYIDIAGMIRGRSWFEKKIARLFPSSEESSFAEVSQAAEASSGGEGS